LANCVGNILVLCRQVPRGKSGRSTGSHHLLVPESLSERLHEGFSDLWSSVHSVFREIQDTAISTIVITRDSLLVDVKAPRLKEKDNVGWGFEMDKPKIKVPYIGDLAGWIAGRAR
jgi:hypothetical protein